MNENNTISEFDRLVGALDGLPDVTKSKPSTIREKLPLIGIARSFIVQTYRMKDKGDTVFIETIGSEGTIRLTLPPAVVNAIVRQRDSLTGKVRSKTSKQVMADRMAAGHKPAFLVKKKKEA